MILTTEQIINSNYRCEEWPSERITEFMNTPPYVNTGEKNIQNFIESIGVCDITYDEIFWVIITDYLNTENRIEFCIYLLNLYANKLNIDYSFFNDSINTIKTNPIYFISDIEFLINELDSKINYTLNIEKDVTDTYRFYKFTKLFLSELVDGSDLILITKKIKDGIILDYTEYTIQFILNYLQNHFD